MDVPDVQAALGRRGGTPDMPTKLDGFLTSSQQAAIIGCYKAPVGMWKPRKVILDALVRRGYAIRTRSGAMQLTEAGVNFAKDGTRI